MVLIFFRINLLANKSCVEKMTLILRPAKFKQTKCILIHATDCTINSKQMVSFGRHILTLEHISVIFFSAYKRIVLFATFSKLLYNTRLKLLLHFNNVLIFKFSLMFVGADTRPL